MPGPAGASFDQHGQELALVVGNLFARELVDHEPSLFEGSRPVANLVGAGGVLRQHPQAPTVASFTGELLEILIL